MKRFVAKRSAAIRESKPTRTTSDAIDVAARYFVYKLFGATDGRPEAWHALRELGERAETVTRAVVRGWVVVRNQRKGRLTRGSAALTDEGRRMARRSFH
jgi:hypothetical protein